jgi:class 3 adenylate cyclase/tetratricopeptide (TPR) repeat protein
VLTCPNCGRDSPDDFSFCPVCASPLRPADAGGEIRKTVTVVFCDVTGSTSIGERLDPESLRRVMARYFDAMRAALEHHGGTVEKFIGDAVMAVFGVPTVHEDDALRAVRAASEMRSALATLNKELERDHGIALTVRIGVNTGEVVAGDTDQTLVTGDAVNVAARLEQAAEPGTVLLGAETMRLVRDAVIVEELDPLTVKGKAEPLAAFRLVDVTGGGPVGRRRLDSPMVGRERQLSQIHRAFEAATADRSCQLFTVLGSPGVGKSRLVEEFLGPVQHAATVLRGRCLPYGDGITFFPVGEVVKEAAGLDDFDPPEEIERKICAVLGDAEEPNVCSTLAQLFGVSERDTAPDERSWAVRRFLEVVAESRPLVVVFDDIHWGEPTFLDLIEHITDWSRGAPILVLCMARPDLLDVRPTWGGGKFNAATISLEPLSDRDCVDLMANLVGRAELPDDVQARILEHAEGTPLFVEEMLAMLIDDGRLVRDGDRWSAVGDLSTVAVPPTIQALLAARLDQLTGDERAVIQRASVEGKQFHIGAVRALLDDTALDVRGTLMGLVRRDLIAPDRSLLQGDDAFRFRHQLIRDAAYEAAPKALRAELHERFAAWLIDVAGDHVAEQEEIVAYHLERAFLLHEELGPLTDEARAIGVHAAERYRTCARRASERGDESTAAALYRHVVDLLPEDHPQRPRALYELAHAHGNAFEAPEALAAADGALAAAIAAGDESLQWLARVDRTLAQLLGDPHARVIGDVRTEFLEALQAFERLRDDRGLAETWLAMTEVDWMSCSFDDALEHAERAEYHARATRDRRLLQWASLKRQAAQMFGSTKPEDALRSIDAMLAEFDTEGPVRSISLVHQSIYAAYQGDLDRARHLSDEAIAAAERLGNRFMLAASSGFRGQIELLAGDPSAAEPHVRREHDTLLALGDDGHRSTSAAEFAVVLCDLGRVDEADRLATDAMSLAAEDDLASQVFGRLALARVGTARGDHEHAVAVAREAVEMYADAQCPEQSGQVWFTLALALRGAGRDQEAIDAARTAMSSFERKGIRPAAASVRAFIEEIGSAST